MSVLEFIRKHLFQANPGMEYIVKAAISGRTYYCGNGTHIRPEVRNMNIYRWCVDIKQNRFVMIVEQDVKFEKQRDMNWSGLIE